MQSDKLNQLIGDSDSPLLCLEVNPPRGCALEDTFNRLKDNLKGVSFFNVTDGALAHMRCAALPFSALLKQKFGIEVLANVACRDRNLLAIQADLLASWAMGIRSVVALTGDAMTIGDSPDRKSVFEVNSIGLLHTIHSLNSGHDLGGHELKGRPDFVAGVVVNPNARNMAVELKRLQQKKEAGARYALSQPVFDEVSSTQFFKEACSLGLPMLMGLLAIKSPAALKTLNSIPGIRLSEGFVSGVRSFDQNADISDFSMQHCLKLAKANLPFVRGFHVVTGATPTLALRLVKMITQEFGIG